MKYKVAIAQDGTCTTTVIDPGKHACSDIVHVANSFGVVQKVNKKQDDVPVFNSVHVGGHNV